MKAYKFLTARGLRHLRLRDNELVAVTDLWVPSLSLGGGQPLSITFQIDTEGGKALKILEISPFLRAPWKDSTWTPRQLFETSESRYRRAAARMLCQVSGCDQWPKVDVINVARYPYWVAVCAQHQPKLET